LDVSREEPEALLEQARQEPLPEDGYQKLRAAIRTLHYVTELLEKKETTLRNKSVRCKIDELPTNA
jgi:hypothetical protein